MPIPGEHHPAFEEYCECIFELQEDDVDVIQARIADRVQVSRPAVSEMMRRLETEGLITTDAGIHLTDAGRALFHEYAPNAIEVPGQATEELGRIASTHGLYLVVGVIERAGGTLYCTALYLGPDGRLLGKHRKLVPTWAEKLTWTGGDGSSLRVYDTGIGPLGGLACGENTNTLARFALLGQGELVHVASYISLPVAPPDYDMAEAIKLRAIAHSFEGKIFTIVSCSTVSEEIITAMETVVPDARARLQRKSSAFSGIIGPDGRVVGDALIDDEGIVYADIDLDRCIQPKQMHDIVGHYNRFDIFDLRVNRRPLAPLGLVEGERVAGDAAEQAGFSSIPGRSE